MGFSFFKIKCAAVVKLADARDLGSRGATRNGSNPFSGTKRAPCAFAQGARLALLPHGEPSERERGKSEEVNFRLVRSAVGGTSFLYWNRGDNTPLAFIVSR